MRIISATLCQSLILRATQKPNAVKVGKFRRLRKTAVRPDSPLGSFLFGSRFTSYRIWVWLTT